MSGTASVGQRCLHLRAFLLLFFSRCPVPRLVEQVASACQRTAHPGIVIYTCHVSNCNGHVQAIAILQAPTIISLSLEGAAVCCMRKADLTDESARFVDNGSFPPKAYVGSVACNDLF